MPIQILPARLANQIAAGEVVERPASVVKELVENSIDAGATRIEIDIEKGGSKLIRIRDNGAGIVKDELELALSRHATSKISSLDDLEAIISLGFRGEALASISSVSRLTLTSKTQQQTEAWSAYAEGRNMSVTIKPTAHPVGTTVEVVDLFFNTPARRKFLRTDKTEFNHIDELLKRIALSRFDIDIILRHNGAIIRQYRAANNKTQQERRLAAVCSLGFVNSSIEITLEHQGLSLQGWICTPQGARAQNDIQHCFVNRRMMKDKLINHAIRQGYETALPSEKFAAYVLYIEIDPQQVDVNVHPAKHEVRFHQARLVHDFIYQSINDALSQLAQTLPQLSSDEPISSSDSIRDHYDIEHNTFTKQTKWQAQKTDLLPSSQINSSSYNKERMSARSNTSSGFTTQIKKEPSLNEQSTSYQALMSTPNLTEQAPTAHDLSSPSAEHHLGKALAVISAKYLLLLRAKGLALLDLNAAANLLMRGQLRNAVTKDGLKAQPLLIPQRLTVSSQEMSIFEKKEELLQRFGIIIRIKSTTQMIVMAVCQPLRQCNLQQIIPEILDFFSKKDDKYQKDKLDDAEALSIWLANKLTIKIEDYALSQAITLISELENCWQNELTTYYSSLLRSVDITAAMEAFEYE